MKKLRNYCNDRQWMALFVNILSVHTLTKLLVIILFAVKKSLSRNNLYRGNSTTTTNCSLLTTIERIQSIIKSSANYSDYSGYLFERVPTKEDGFVGKTHYLLYTSYKNVQQNAQVNFKDIHKQLGSIFPVLCTTPDLFLFPSFCRTTAG